MELPYSLSILKFIGLCFFAFLAGLIDSIVGGGGLIQLPAIMMMLPDVPVVTQLAINKTSSSFGTCMATWQYSRKLQIAWKQVLPIALLALAASMGGAETATRIPNHFMRPMVIILLAGMIIFTLLKKDLGETQHTPQLNAKQQIIIGAVCGILIGFYDGFFGPGTGNFLILSLIFIYGYDFLHASASAKVINLATNIGALILFYSRGVGNITLGLCMAVFNMTGAFCGVRLAVLKGSRFIKILFIVISVGLLIKQITG